MNKKLTAIIFLLVLTVFGYTALKNMSLLPFSEFDEANRAEGARNMAKFSYWWAPITGSPFFRRDDLSFKFNDNSKVNIHLERNPLVFIKMAGFVKIFGDKEISYRLPSFIFSLGTMLLLFLLFKKEPLLSLLSLTPLLFSYDWWSSSQMAHLDIGLTFFMTVALVLLIFGKEKKDNWFILSIFIFLAFLSKGQMIIFLITPLFMALFLGKISIKSFIKTGLMTFLLIFISLLPILTRHGFKTWFDVYVMGILSSRATTTDLSQAAPVWWYGYWWMFSFRWGVFLFVPLLCRDIFEKRIDKEKLILFVFIVFNFLLMSLAKNKVWWYVMPLMPAISMYIYRSIENTNKEKKLFNLLIVFLISVVPLFWQIEISLKRVVAYCALVVFINTFVLIKDFKVKKIPEWFFVPIILFSAFIFYRKFPRPSASFPEVRKLLSGIDLSDSCLFVENMPYEGVMYYSKAGEINYWQEEVKKGCPNYLVSPNNFEFEKIKEVDRLKLYKIVNE